MKEWSLALFTTLLLVTKVGYGENLNAKAKDTAHAKTVELLRKMDLVKNPSYEKSASAQGGVHSGGGNLVYTAKATGLLDLYLYNQPAFLSTEKGLTLTETKAFKEFGIERIGRNNRELLLGTIAQIKKWEKSSPFMTTFLRRAILGLQMYYVNHRLGYEDRLAYVPPNSGLKPENLRLAAFYLADFGCFVDKKSFDALSLPNQIALLIHEALRQEQLSFQMGITNENIQRLTAAVLRDPQEGETLDAQAFFGEQIPAGLQREFTLHEVSKWIVKLYCAKLQSNCDLDPRLLTITDEMAKRAAVTKLAGESLLMSMTDSLAKYRYMNKDNKTEFAETTDLLYVIVAQISLLGDKRIADEHGDKDRYMDAEFTKSAQGTSSIDLTLNIYNNKESLESYFTDFKENSNVRRFMRDMKAAGYFK